MPRPRDHLANLAASILDTADELDSPVRRENLGDALEVIVGEPDVDNVLGMPVALWDRLRDLQKRLGQIEDEVFVTDLLGRIQRLEAMNPRSPAPPSATDQANDGDPQGPILVFPRPGADRYELLNSLTELPVDEARFTTRAEVEALDAAAHPPTKAPVDLFGNVILSGTVVAGNVGSDGTRLRRGVVLEAPVDQEGVFVVFDGGAPSWRPGGDVVVMP